MLNFLGIPNRDIAPLITQFIFFYLSHTVCSVSKRFEILWCGCFVQGQTVRLTSKYGVVLKSYKVCVSIPVSWF